jgi:hypothetical protein
VNGPHAKVSAGRRKRSDAYKILDPAAQAGFLSVYDGTRCLGFLLPRGKLGVEAYDRDDKSLGVFPNQKSAADAVSGAAT